ncbi:MAG TPA: hypothetical protein VN666_10185 [Nitrospira sp.]|nr:hypothetical protein [Nitrospira sp.]
MQYLLVMVLFFSWLITGFAEGASELQRDSLRGLPGVVVVVEDIRPDAKRDGVSEEEIRTAVELILRSSGIRILTDGIIPDDPAMLVINIGASKSPTIPLYGFCITGQLTQWAYLVKQSGRRTSATTWGDGFSGLVSSQRLKAFVIEHVESLAKSFANDFLSVNPR